MNPAEQHAWLDEALDFLTQALASHTFTRQHLAFKGARTLKRLLNNTGRASMDLDATLMSKPDPAVTREELAAILQSEITMAIRRAIDVETAPRFELLSISVTPRPRREPHERGWNAYDTRIRLRDARHASVNNLRALTMDIAAPEEILPEWLIHLPVGEETVRAYSLAMITGEKLRALLSSLPEYREKMAAGERLIRAKDLHDIARVLIFHDNRLNREFSLEVAGFFQHVCRSRFVNCEGISSFDRHRAEIRLAYEQEPSLKNGITFETAWDCLTQLLREIEPFCDFPWDHPAS